MSPHRIMVLHWSRTPGLNGHPRSIRGVGVHKLNTLLQSIRASTTRTETINLKKMIILSKQDSLIKPKV